MHQSLTSSFKKSIFLQAKHSFQASEDNEISFQKGEKIELLERDEKYNDGWYFGRNVLGKKGIFPANFTIEYEEDNIELERNSDDLYSVISRKGDHSRSQTDASIVYNDLSLTLSELIESPDVLTPTMGQELTGKPRSLSYHETIISLPSKISSWSQDHIQVWLETIQNLSNDVFRIFEEYEITGSDLDLLNHAKLAIMGIESSAVRTVILEAIVELGIDVPTHPTIMTRRMERNILVRGADKNDELPVIPTCDDKMNLSVIDAEEENTKKYFEPKYESIATHLRTGSKRSHVSSTSQFTISDYYKIPTSEEFQNEEMRRIEESFQNMQPPTTIEQVFEERNALESSFFSSFSAPKHQIAKQIKDEEENATFNITMNELKSLTINPMPPSLSIVNHSDTSSTASKKSSITSLFPSKMVNSFLRRNKCSHINPSDDLYESLIDELDLDLAVISGWLSVKHEDKMIWTKRYCAVIGSIFYASKSIEKFVPILSLQISSPTQIQPSTQTQKNRPYTFQFSNSPQDVYLFSCTSQYEMIQWINVLVRISDSSFEKSRKVLLIPIKRNLEENQDTLNDFILSPQQQCDSIRGIKVMTMNPPERMPGSKRGYQGMKESKYLPERPRIT